MPFDVTDLNFGFDSPSSIANVYRSFAHTRFRVNIFLLNIFKIENRRTRKREREKQTPSVLERQAKNKKNQNTCLQSMAKTVKCLNKYSRRNRYFRFCFGKLRDLQIDAESYFSCGKIDRFEGVARIM